MGDINQARRLLLAEYERERDELAVMIARLRKELGMAAEESAETEQATVQPQTGSAGSVEELVKPGDFYRMSQLAAVRVFLERRGERNTASLQEIAQALLRGKAIEAPLDEKGMRNLSSNLSKTGDFESIAKGRWGLTKWYGGAGKAKRKKQEFDDSGQDATSAADDSQSAAATRE